MVSTLTYTGELVITSCWCGIKLAVPRDLYDIAHRNGTTSIYCPLGHQFIFGDSETADLKKKLATANQRLGWAETREKRAIDNYNASERSLRAYKGHLTRARNKIALGNCPACDKHFSNVREHMKHIHPEYGITDPVTGEKAVL